MPDQPTPAEGCTPDVPDELLASAMRAWSDNGPGKPGNWSAEQQVRAILTAVLPDHERQIRQQASTEIMAKAEALGPTIVGPRASFRRGLEAAARRILPEPTLQEIADAITSGNAVFCNPEEPQ
jgi:hypothetical protein